MHRPFIRPMMPVLIGFIYKLRAVRCVSKLAHVVYLPSWDRTTKSWNIWCLLCIPIALASHQQQVPRINNTTPLRYLTYSVCHATLHIQNSPNIKGMPSPPSRASIFCSGEPASIKSEKLCVRKLENNIIGLYITIDFSFFSIVWLFRVLQVTVSAEAFKTVSVFAIKLKHWDRLVTQLSTMIILFIYLLRRIN